MVTMASLVVVVVQQEDYQQLEDYLPLSKVLQEKPFLYLGNYPLIIIISQSNIFCFSQLASLVFMRRGLVVLHLQAGSIYYELRIRNFLSGKAKAQSRTAFASLAQVFLSM